MPGKWPNFLEQNLPFQTRAARLRNSLEHPEMHQHADDYAHLLHRPFSLHHDLAAQALLKIHDANKKNTKPLQTVAEAYKDPLLAEYRITRNPGLRNFLFRLRGELETRRINVEPPEAEEKPNPLAKIGHALKEDAIVETLRELLRTPHSAGRTYGQKMEKADEKMKMSYLLHALIRYTIAEDAERGAELDTVFVDPHVAESARQILAKAGFDITREERTKRGLIVLTFEPRQVVLNFLKNYPPKTRG